MDGEEYLDRYAVTSYVKDVVTLLLENRPSSPIAFMVQYFRTVAQGTASILRAFRYIQLAQPGRPVFSDNVSAAYAALDSRRGAGGITGASLHHLLKLVCTDCPLNISHSLLALLERAETEPISYSEFSSVVHAAIHYSEFFRRVAVLAAMADPQCKGCVPSGIMQSALRIVQGTGDRDDGMEALLSGGPADAPPASTALRRLRQSLQFEVGRLGSPNPGRLGATVPTDDFIAGLFAASLAPLPTANAALKATTLQAAAGAAHGAAAAGGIAAETGGSGSGVSGSSSPMLPRRPDVGESDDTSDGQQSDASATAPGADGPRPPLRSHDRHSWLAD